MMPVVLLLLLPLLLLSKITVVIVTKREWMTMRTSVRNNWCNWSDCCLSQSIIEDEEKVNHIRAALILPMNSLS